MKSILYFASRNQCGAIPFEIARSLLPAMRIPIKQVYQEQDADEGREPSWTGFSREA
jgi:hypothetical protein